MVQNGTEALSTGSGGGAGGWVEREGEVGESISARTDH